ncbi:MAG TPA: sigma-54-dependent Fis family transcriptional regulator [Desulfobacterales bacterium]|nr:sigma-54-dependent Fis family transcriptional regulator [Desulfobacterales bacterium]
MTKRRVMIVDDDQAMCEMLEAALKRKKFQVSWFLKAEEALARLREDKFDTALADINMPGMSGIEFCERAAANRPDVPVIIMTAFGSLETAIAAMRAGAYDFITKPVELELLILALERALEHSALREQVRLLSQDGANKFSGIIGKAVVMEKFFEQLRRVAATETSVLIVGESGVGKELAARALHNEGRRQAAAFVPINCAALPENLLESELFGHKQGAFTDAKNDRRGLFMEANGGTLFLDEVGEIPLSLQPKLLRALEERRVRPVGGDREHPFDVRIIAATNRDLETAVEEGVFREDLFYRLNVIQLEIPPLRARGTDILLLARYFIQKFAATMGRDKLRLSEKAAQKLLSYSWPGNVRELRNAVERAVAMCRFDQLMVEDFPKKIWSYESQHVLVGAADPTELVSLPEVERRYILHVLKTVAGNRSQAARILRLDRKTLYRKLQSYEKV